MPRGARRHGRRGNQTLIRTSVRRDARGVYQDARHSADMPTKYSKLHETNIPGNRSTLTSSCRVWTPGFIVARHSPTIPFGGHAGSGLPVTQAILKIVAVYRTTAKHHDGNTSVFCRRGWRPHYFQQTRSLNAWTKRRIQVLYGWGRGD